MLSELINMDKEIQRKEDAGDNLHLGGEPRQKRNNHQHPERNLISEAAIEQVKDCTYFLYGDMQVEQTMFICGRCDFYQLDPLCEACYSHCHKECYTKDNKKPFGNLLGALPPKSQLPGEANSKFEKESDFKRKVNKKETKRMMKEQQKAANKGRKSFACICGKKHKHQKHRNHSHGDQQAVERCNLENEMPASLCTTKAKSYCQECDTQICAMCASGCHFFHNVMSALPNKEDETYCFCSNSNHQMNDFLLNSYFNNNTVKIKFPVLISSKTKTMNMMFLTRDLFHNLSIFLQKFLKTSTSNLKRTLSQSNATGLSNFNPQKTKAGIHPEEVDSNGLKVDDNMRKFLDVSGIFFKILYEKHDKCYFYNEELKKIFSYHNSFLLIEHLCELEYDTNNSRMILNLVGIVFYLHLKADFQRVKNFTISDFMGSKIVTRLKHKSKLTAIQFSKENETEGNLQNNDPYANLKKYFHELSSLATISIKLTKIITDCLPTLSIFTNSTLYEVCLRFINFGLKKMYFTKANLKSLIDNLFIFINEFHQLLFLPKNIRNLQQNFQATKFVFYYLIKICYLIAVNYNDMVTEKLVAKYKTTSLLSVNENRKKFIHSNEKHGDKLLKMILKTVTIVSESYTYDILLDRKVINICNESLKIFSITENFYMGQLCRLKDKEILSNHDDRFSPSVSLSLATKLSNKIENIFIGDYTDVLSGETELNLEIDQIFRELLRSVPIDSDPHSNRNKEEMDNPKKAKIFHYKIKLLNFFSDVLGYSSREEFYFMYSSLLNSEAFVNDIISDNFDEIISKYFSLFKLKSLDHNDINSAFSIYLLYFMDRRGVEHFCTGKNLSIISKLFASQKNAKLLLTDETKLEFLFLLVKGIFLYKIDLSNDKCIYNFTAIIDLVLTDDDEEMRNNIHNLPNVNEIPFKAKQRMIKIFSMLKDSFEFEEFENIQEIFFSKFRKLLDPDLFRSHIKEFQSKLLDPKINPKREPIVKIGEEFKVQNRQNELNYNSEKGFNTKYSTANYDEKTKLIGEDMESVRPNLLQDEQILRLSDNNFTITMYKAKSYALKFYFSLFNFLSIDTYYIFYDFPEELAQLEEIHKFMDLEYMREILGKSFLPLNYRTNLLVFLRTFFFINILDSKGKSQRNYITTEEMYKYLNKLYSPEELPEIEHKAQLIFKIVAVMDIFASELETFDKLLKTEPYYFEDVEHYLIQIVYSIKVLSDFVYYQKSIWENVNWYIYKIGKRFLQKANIIKNILISIKIRHKVGDILDEDLEITKTMEHVNFNIYNKDLIYNHISDSLIDILKATNVDKNFKLEKFLKEHDKKIKNDFTPTGSIQWKGYDELYAKKEKNIQAESKGGDKQKYDKTKVLDEHSILWIADKKKVQKNPLVKILKKVYKTTFIRIYDTCLMRVINTYRTKDDSVDYRRIILDYFIKFMSSDPENKKFFVKVSNKIYTEETTLTLLIIIVKLLYYDTKNTQSVFDHLNEKYVDPMDDEALANEQETPDACKQFFKSFFNKLQKIFVLNFSTSINFFMFDRYSEISELNKLMIQFLQLLTEGFNVNFKSKIFELKLTRTESISIFDIIYTQFKTAYNLMDLHAKIANNNELSHYKLLVLFSNIVDFFVEYIEGTDLSHSNKITEMMENFFDDKIHKSLLVIIDDEHQSISTAKIELCKKLLLRVKSKILEVVIAFVENGVDEVFLKKIQKELPMTRLFEEIQHYLHELLEKIQSKGKSGNSDHYQHLMNVYRKDKTEFKYFLTKLYILDNDFSESLDLNFCLKLFMYLDILSEVYGIKTIHEHFAQLINKAISHNSVTSFLSPQAFKVYKFMKNIVRHVEVKNIEENKTSKTFFFRPPITFYLSDPSKRQFMDNVDRESRFSKLSSLIKQTDYFMFEMVYYSHFNYIGRKINESLDLYYLEIFNYILIIIQQLLLLVQFYVSTAVPGADYQISLSDKYIIQRDSYILALIQIGYISVILILWLFFQFPLKLFNNLMDNDSTFLFNKEGEEKRDIIEKYNQTSTIKGTLSHIYFLRNVNRNSSFWQMVKISLLDCLFINREVNTFAFTLIFIILYLTTKSAIFIVFPILFILNIIPILFGMFVALRTKWKQLGTMLIFTFLCIYFYMWITFYFIYPLFTYGNIYLPDQGSQNTENLCTSAIECYLTMIDAGFRSGGGIGDQLPFASWEQDTSFFMIHFFYKMTFYIFIILILSNSCFGIIIDAFSDLRDRTNAIEEDKKNICYTCQLSRDNSLNKGINFDLHTKKQHFPWNYVYFITHLLLNDPNEFNHSEYYAWEKVTTSTNDVGWIPGETEDNNI